MKKIDIFKKELEKDWYVQALGATPIFINSAALSGFTMKKELGFEYTDFVFTFQNGLGEMWYLKSDLNRIWGIIRRKLNRYPDYLNRIKKKYERNINKSEFFFRRINKSDLQILSEEDLLKLMKESARTITDAVGIAHILEAVGLEIEKEFEDELSATISDKKELNQIYISKTTPRKTSFIAREEDDLRKISHLSSEKKEKALALHAKKYFWIQNSYVGQKNLNISFFRKRLKEIKEKPINQAYPQDKFETGHVLSRKAKDLAEIIRFTIIWQDERKENILKSIEYLDKIFKEVEKRTDIKRKLLHYLGATEISYIDSLNQIRKLKRELIQREKGVFIRLEKKGETFVSGKGYAKLIEFRKKTSHDDDKGGDEIRGSIANGGKIIGKVVICKSANSINKVKHGEILVVSMTRPEYMPALKKAAAIITDEGGITSHAAIIARELGIPAVIGTKIATKVLKDGDLVEVRANHGVVKILKRK